MTTRRMSPRRTRFAAHAIALFLLLGIGLLLSPTANAGSDDFEFGQKLAAKGRAMGDPTWFDYARQVYQGILDDRSRSKQDKDLARYGMAKLKSDEALAAASRRDVPYPDVKAAFNEAVTGIEQFVSDNPKHPEVFAAKMSVGTVRLAFVQWARDLLGDIDMLNARKGSELEVQGDARAMVERALAYFDELDDGWATEDGTEEQQLAHYNWVVCKYYSALVHVPCSADAKEALGSAGDALEEFIGYFDGMLVAIYAQDFYGLVFWELARCATAEDDQAKHYRSAVDWFETCIETEWTGLDSLRIIARGYHHIAQCCLDAGRIGADNFLKKGAGFLRRMLDRVPTVNTTDDGIRAMIEWARIESRLDNTDKAIEILSQAGQKAEETGRPWLAHRANAVIGETLAGGSRKSGGATVSPDVLKRVADNQFAAKNYLGAIGAYQNVIAACTDSQDDLMTYAIPSWERIAQCYYNEGDLLAASLATEPIHAAWTDGRVPRKKDDANDANLLRMGRIRLRSRDAMKQLYEQTQSAVYRKRWAAIRDSFKSDYPNHPEGEALEYRLALEHYAEARKKKRKKDSSWRGLLDKAVSKFESIAKDPKSAAQHSALVMLIRCERLREKWSAMVKRADDAFTYWASPQALAQVKEHETVADRVKKAKGKATYWKAAGLLELKEYDQVIDLMSDFPVKHGGIDDEQIMEDALGMLVLAYVAKGDIDTADTHLRRLLRQHPKYFRLPAITFRLADYYNAKYSEIETLYKAAVAKKYGTADDRSEGLVFQMRAAGKNENFIAERLIDLNGERSTLQRLIDTWDEAMAEEKATGKKQDVKGVTQEKVDLAHAKITGQEDPPEGVEDDKWPEKYQVGLVKTIATLNIRLKELTATREKLEGDLVEVNKEIKGYKQGMYSPLVRAANYYYDWKIVAEAAGETLTAKNLEIFGYRFYYATVLDPDDPDNWLKAQEIYEQYVKLPGISDAERSSIAAKLGRIYSHLSEVSDNEADQKRYVLDAVELLQAAVAKVPDNNALVVGLLTGEYVVVPYRSPLDQQQYRIPMRRVKDVADFRSAVKQLGTEAGPLPKFRSDRKQKGFDDAIREFQNDIVKMTDKALQRTVKGFLTAGFDTSFYRSHGNTNREFMLSLARVYAQSGRADDARKAISLTQTLLNSRTLGVDEGSEEYWEAQVIKFGAYVKAAEIGLAGANTKAGAKELLELASRSIEALYSQDPSLGKNVRDETEGQLKAILAQMNVLRQKAGLSVLKLKLKARLFVDTTDDNAGNKDPDKDPDTDPDKDK